ncbi:MAG: glycosyltransferase family 2 protein [Candidatus Bathyarchaeales archaeon]
MIEKVDLVMWTRNGAETLPIVLRRINSAIPSEFVNNKIIVDDKSTDDTRKIAKSFGWNVILNEGAGISDGANTALKYVTPDFFISFEQDLLLAPNWWQRVPRLLNNPRVAVASGIRLPDQPLVLRRIQQYTYEKYRVMESKGEFIPYTRTIDNTIYKTKIIRQIGGFPKLSGSAGVDQILAQRVHSTGFKWEVDYEVMSIHLRKGLQNEIAHNYWYGTCLDELEHVLFKRNANIRRLLLRFVFSPLRGLHIALTTREPRSIYIHPLIRLAVIRGIVDKRKGAV